VTDRDAGSAGRARETFARAWADALEGTSYVALTRPELEHLTLRLTDLLTAALDDPPRIDVDQLGERIGQELVGAHFTGPASLERTVTLLGSQLPHHLSRPGDDRIAVLTGAVAAAYTRALLAVVLTEQEQIRLATRHARDRAQAALQATEARFQAVFTDAAVGIGIGDVEGRILDVNPALVTMLGYPPAEFRRRTVADFLHPDDAPSVWEDYRDLVEGRRESFRAEKRFFRADGATLWTQLTVSLIRGPDGAPRFQAAIIEDVTDRHRLTERLAYEATHDPLTDLPNRALFLTRLTDALADPTTGARVGLCLLDLDSFKVVNDSLGHVVGDQLLTTIADRLAGTATSADTGGGLVARLGGDEFVVLTRRPEPARLAELARRLHATVAAPIAADGHQLTVTASIGTIDAPAGNATTSADLLRAADITLQQAKAAGSGRVAFHNPDRDATQLTLYTLAATLPGALDRGEFTLLYQPLVRLSDESLRGVEALLRWQHPRFGTLGPDHFIRLAEQTGAILPLGRWILAEACRTVATHRDALPDLLLSVNVAVRQLQHPDFLDDVTRALTDTGLPPHRLQLEVTEHALMTGDPDGPPAALHKLADLGVRIAIDDFGTGYSNLAYLRRLPVHELKLAGAFLDGLRNPDDADPADLHLVTTLIHLAHGLDLTVTAEAVETPAQAACLRDLGADTAQGWHYGRPSALDRIARSTNPSRHQPNSVE
jgi:diguanylate cyclase (GGDEF)-like protein/PAS domain S-box-containing protein